MNVLLPKAAHGRKLVFAHLKHPCTGKPTKFLVDKDQDPAHPLYELTRVGTDARSALVGDQVYTDGSVIVATPLHPLYMLVPVLYEQRKRALPLDFLLSLSADEQTEALDEEVFISTLDTICDHSPAGQYVLNLEKLKSWLDIRVQSTRAGLPPMAKAEVLKVFQPLNPADQPSPEIVDAAESYAAASMLATSWLCPEVAEWYLASCDFSILEAEIRRLEVAQLALSGARIDNSGYDKRPASEQKSASNAKRVKTLPVVKNNTSILDMFQRARPSKSS